MTPTPERAPPADAYALERAAAGHLAAARACASVLHMPGERERHRREIEQAIALAGRAIAACEEIGGLADDGAVQGAANAGAHGDPTPTLARARSTLIEAHAARARDARHGAGQLSLGSQRAPTLDACDDGWQRVEEIVAAAEASARAAVSLAATLGDRSALQAARDAEAAARGARRLVDERNDAYTFHADPGFSFGEGWYLAAAAILADVSIQIEPGKAQTAPAERFLRDAGLAGRLVPYRPRPRANKQLPELVARAFRADPVGAQRRLRAAFLGEGPIPQPIVAWADRRLGRTSTPSAPRKKVLLWVRYGRHHPARNTSHSELVELARRARAADLDPLLIGDALRDGDPPLDAVDMTLFWKDPLFQGLDMRRAQLQLFEHLRQDHALVGQLGVTTAGMDGPALLGLPTMYLTDAPNVRLGQWVGAIPNYEEVVRGAGYLERTSDRLRRW